MSRFETVIDGLRGFQGRHPRVFLSGVQFEQPLGFPLKACGNDGPAIQVMRLNVGRRRMEERNEKTVSVYR